MNDTRTLELPPFPTSESSTRAPSLGEEPRPLRLVLDETEAAAYLGGLSVRTLQSWRTSRRRGGPAFVRVGRSIRYRVADLDAFLARGLVPEGETLR